MLSKYIFAIQKFGVSKIFFYFLKKLKKFVQQEHIKLIFNI